MIKNIKFNLLTGFIFLLISSLYFAPITSADDPVYNAEVVIDFKWGDELTDAPIVPRDEIVELKLTVNLEIKTGLTFGQGLLDGYEGNIALIDLFIEDHPSWCYATLKSDLLMTNVTSKAEASTYLYLTLDETAPAYANGYIKIRVKVSDLGLIKGDDETFNLLFKPAYLPIIKIDLPEANTKRINPSSKAIFPIEIENAGNSRTKVFFELEDIPEDWTVTITDSIILEDKGSRETVYLTVIPAKGIGYHYDDAILNVKITPTLADDKEQKGTPIFASFIVQNRGFSSAGMEFYLSIFAIIILIIFILIGIRNIRKRKEKTV